MMMDSSKSDYRDRIDKIKKFIEPIYPKLPYHNSGHAFEVWKLVHDYGIKAGIPYQDRLSLEIAALFHDIIVVPGKTDNEENSADLADSYLNRNKFHHYIPDNVRGLILATKVPTSPKSLLEKIICDSDVDNFGRDDFFEKGEKVRQEIEMTGKTFNDIDWYKTSLSLLQNHQYYTSLAREKRDAGKMENIRELNRIIEEYNVSSRMVSD